jgi:DNA primase
VFLPDGEDPDSLVRDRGSDAFTQFLNNATPGIEYLFSKLSEGLDLQSLDGRARFMGLANPFVEKIPDGILKDLVKARVREIGGMAAPVTGSARVPNRPIAEREESSNVGSALAQKMLSMLLKAPALWASLDESIQRDMLAQSRDMGLLGRLVNFLADHPEADANEILIGWPEEGEQAQLIEFAKKSSASGRDAWPKELADGCTHLLHQQQKKLRQRQRADLLAQGDEQKILETLPVPTSRGDA